MGRSELIPRPPRCISSKFQTDRSMGAVVVQDCTFSSGSISHERTAKTNSTKHFRCAEQRSKMIINNPQTRQRRLKSQARSDECALWMMLVGPGGLAGGDLGRSCLHPSATTEYDML